MAGDANPRRSSGPALGPTRAVPPVMSKTERDADAAHDEILARPAATAATYAGEDTEADLSVYVAPAGHPLARAK